MLADFFSYDVLIAFGLCAGAAAATMIGCFSIFMTKSGPSPRLLAFGLAFAGGAMVYVSLVEIFQKSYASFGESYLDKSAYGYATLALFAGVGLVLLLDKLIPNPHHALADKDVGHVHAHGHDHHHYDIKKIGLLAAAAITAHNFPEGMATFFAALDNPAVGGSLAFAIAIHNIPEGVSIAIPVYHATGSRKKAVLACLISALAEPVGALLGYVVLQPFLSPTVYGVIFGVIAGVMVFLALDELLPSAKRYSRGHEAVYGIISGMALLAISLVLFK